MDSDPRTPRPSSVAEDLFAEHAIRVSEGMPDDIEGLCRAHPEHADELRALHARHAVHKQLRRAQSLGSLPGTSAACRGIEEALDLSDRAKR